MYQIFFYRDRGGKQPVLDYLRELCGRGDKDSRIKANKIQDYIEILCRFGLQAGEPYVKHLDGDIWELRPLRDRILFAGFVDGSFVLLHVFMKQTRKTPVREIEKAKREFAEFKERECGHE